MSLQNQMHQPYGSPAPQVPSPLPFHQPPTWATPATPTPLTTSARPVRATRTSLKQSQPAYSYPGYPPTSIPAPPRGPLPTKPQALDTSYGSRLRTGVTLLMQPIITSSTAAGLGGSGALGGGAGGMSGITTSNIVGPRRRAGPINYAELGSGDELDTEKDKDYKDSAGIDSDDSDFVASGSTRGTLRSRALPNSRAEKQHPMVDQSYLGQLPPERFITSKRIHLIQTDNYFSPDVLRQQAEKPVIPVPIRVELETNTHRIRDCFVWNLNEELITPLAFAATFCADLDLPADPFVEQVSNQIRAQLEENGVVAAMPLGAVSQDIDDLDNGGNPSECRVIVGLDVQISTHHLIDHIEWDLLSPLTPEAFSQILCADLGLSSEATPLISHAIHEDLLKHKRDAIEWGVMDAALTLAGGANEFTRGHGPTAGLGGAWGKRGRGPKRLKGVWRDWSDALTGEFGPRLEELSMEELERRELEKERASRRLRRETSKFQTTSRRRR